MNEQDRRAESVEELTDVILCALNDYPTDIWGDALGAAVASLLNAKRDADDAAQEARARRLLE